MMAVVALILVALVYFMFHQRNNPAWLPEGQYIDIDCAKVDSNEVDESLVDCLNVNTDI